LNKSTFSLAAAAAALVLSATPAWADVVTIDLSQNNLGIVGTIGTVTVNLTSTTTATITFQASAGYKFTDGGSAAVNVNATTWGVSTFSPATLTDAGAGNEDGMGSFNQTFNLPNSFPDSQTTISFVLTDTSGTWSGAANVLALNTPGGNGGGYAAAHFGVCDVGCTAFAGGLTGFAAGNTQTFPGGSNVLEPNSASLAVLALGLLGAGLWTRRKL
jgi:hypothetical protein